MTAAESQTYTQAISSQPLVCYQDCCGYPHPHCTWCSCALFWNQDDQWEHVNECVGIPGWEPHDARTLISR